MGEEGREREDRAKRVERSFKGEREGERRSVLEELIVR